MARFEKMPTVSEDVHFIGADQKPSAYSQNDAPDPEPTSF
jgi:hypothetical protein